MNHIAPIPAPRRTPALESVENTDCIPEFYLWRAVIGQSVRDIYGQNPARKREVFVWLRTKDFVDICCMAAVNASSMREQIEALGALPASLAKRYGMELREALLRE